MDEYEQIELGYIPNQLLQVRANQKQRSTNDVA